jgi:signal transduction histidine kinase/CheY-like chemotaxis protein
MGIDPAVGPISAEAWHAFVDRVGKTYLEADQDRYTMERSLTISSREMSELYDALRAAAADLERRVAERTSELQETQARLVASERMAALGQLAAGVAHEINSPLAYVSANIDFALAAFAPAPGPDGGPGEPLSALTQARDGVVRLRQIARDLRLFSHNQNDHREPVDVHRVLESSLMMAAVEIRHRARLVKELGALPTISANEGRLGEVFLNLLINAAQSLPDGAAHDHEIRVRTSVAGAFVKVEITDTGVGIAPENLAHLFEPFFTTKPAGEGTGLGLSICHGIVTKMGGAIEVTSRPGHGSTFTVSLPIGEIRPDERPQPPAPRPAAPPSGRARVLAIDDDPLVLAAIKRSLAGHEVVSIDDGRQALTLLAEDHAFDVILCDIMMPELSGVDLHEQMAVVAPLLQERIVFLTGGAFTAGTRAFLDRVPNRRLDKPFDVQELRDLVGTAAASRA